MTAEITPIVSMTPAELGMLRNVLGSRADKAVEAGWIRLENNETNAEDGKNE
jgi:hypothetical protein